MPNYQVFVNGQGQGPYTPEQLLQYGLNAETLVWTDGMPQWTPARLVPELAARMGIPSSSPATIYPPATVARRPGNGNLLRWFSSGGMAVALVCFLLPFFSITCAQTGQKLVSFSGTQLAFGGEEKVQSPMGDLGSGSSASPSVSPSSDSPGAPPEKKKVNGDIRAMIAFVLTAAGIGLAFMPKKAGSGAVLACALAALLMLVLLRMKIDQEVGTELAAMTTAMNSGSGGMSTSSAPNPFGKGELFRLDYGPGFFVPIVLYVTVGVFGVVGLMKKPAAGVQPG